MIRLLNMSDASTRIIPPAHQPAKAFAAEGPALQPIALPLPRAVGVSAAGAARGARPASGATG